MSERGTCWSVTWYPPTDSMNEAISKTEIDAYAQRSLAPGWRLVDGQMEQCGETGRYHYQAMLRTPQVRKSAVISSMDKAHIEKARSSVALANYVNKEETRVAKVQAADPIPTLFQYQGMIAELYDEEDCKAFIAKRMELTKCQEMYGESFVRYIDTLVAKDIRNGRRGAEFIAVNPMWRSSWKQFGPEIISRHNIQKDGEVFEEGKSGDETQVLAEKADGGWQTVLW